MNVGPKGMRKNQENEITQVPESPLNDKDLREPQLRPVIYLCIPLDVCLSITACTLRDW